MTSYDGSVRKPDFYTTASSSTAFALQVEAARKEEDAILEWVWPATKRHNTPLGEDDLVKGAGEWFVNSSQFTGWVGQGPSTLICPGQGIDLPITCINSSSWRRKIFPCVHTPHLLASLTL